ncbi:MAG: pyridoxamine 5'-phosphate oxidase family protein [Acidimicrobiia bacterium]
MRTSSDTTASTRSLRDVLDGQHVGMLTTVQESAIEARPMTIVDHDDHTVWFLADRHAHWVPVGAPIPGALAIADARHESFASVAGRLRTVEHRERIHELWSAPARAYFDGPDDPALVAVALDVDGGQWWDGPDGRVGQAIALATAVATGDSSRMGDSGAVTT